MTLLKIKNISKTYADGEGVLEVLKDISISIKPAEIVLVMGPSGSGKTTLLNIISMIEKATNGNLLIDGETIDYKDVLLIDRLRAEVLGILFEAKNMLPEFTVLENLEIPYKLNNIADYHNPETVLSNFNLLDKRNYYPSQLSAGESQRISLLRAIINKPKLIVADEPTANLDEENLNMIISFIGKIKIDYGSSFILATHDERLCDVADRILYLNKGKLEERKNKA